MYRFVTEIHNVQASSTIPDVAFHPNGSVFAASYKENNEVRLYDSITKSLIRTYRNPEARFDWPHGVTMTNKHIIVSNKIKSKSKPCPPGIFNVYRIGDSTGAPINVFKTPVKYLSEAHSFAVHNRRLLVTYCRRKSVWAIVSYSFNDETGQISGSTSILESWFALHGAPKGLCFNEDGTKVIVTVDGTHLSKPVSDIIKPLSENVFLRTAKLVQSKFAKQYIGQNKKSDKAVTDPYGIVIFDVDGDGVLSKDPVQTLVGSQFSRPENVSIVKGSCVIANVNNNTVNLYNFNGDHFPDSPIQVIQDHLSFPHDACLSPDKKMLVVTNYGIGVVNGEIKWGSFLHPRSDKLTFYELQK